MLAEGDLWFAAVGVGGGVGDHLAAGAELAGQDLGGERVEQGLLDQALERARAEGRVVAAVGEQGLGGGRDLELEVAVGEAVVEVCREVRGS